MKPNPSRHFWMFVAVVFLFCVTYFSLNGLLSGLSFALGVGSTAAHFLSLRALLAHGAKQFAQPNDNARPTFGAIFVVASALATLPILVGIGLYVQSISAEAFPCFLWGLCLVYFALVGSAMIQR